MKNKEIISLIDHTRLNIDDSFNDFCQWVETFENYSNNIAAICVYFKFIKIIKKNAKTSKAKVATVINFPSGAQTLKDNLSNLFSALANNVDEIDVVVNFKEYNKLGNSESTMNLLSEIRRHCPDKIIKAIVECGEICNKYILNRVINDAVSCGVDFIKTSTGKNAMWTHEQVLIILNNLRVHNSLTKKKVGFKLSGGISDKETALKYIEIVSQMMGKYFISNKYFRIGSSKLLYNLLKTEDKSKQHENEY